MKKGATDKIKGIIQQKGLRVSEKEILDALKEYDLAQQKEVILYDVLALSLEKNWKDLLQYINLTFKRDRDVQQRINELKATTLHRGIDYENMDVAQVDIETCPPEFMQQCKTLAQLPNSEKPPKPPIKYLAAQGGGAKGAAYIGALDAMEKTDSLGQLTKVAGASAGSITMFMVGLGLNGEQVRLLSEALNFNDLSDVNDSVFGLTLGGYKAVQVAGYLGGVAASFVVPNQAYLFTGDNFYHWAKALLTHMVGDPDITFEEFREKCKTNPALKEMTFKAYAYNQTSAKVEREQTFSADITPKARVLDALRASMAFPIMAYSPWQVYEKVDGKLKYFGLFADGGITCNYPIETFDSIEEPEYGLKRTKIPGTDREVWINPCSVGLSLTTLEQLDKTVTPISQELKQKQKKAGVKKKKETKKQENEQISKNSYSTVLGSVIVDALIGRLTTEDFLEKQKTHQTVQICPLDVGVLEFDLSDQRRSELDTLSAKSWELWYKKNLAQHLTYDEKTKEKIKLPEKGKEKAYVEKKLTSYFFNILQERAACKKRGEFEDTNQRLKYNAYRVIEILERSKETLRFSDNEIEEIKNKAYSRAAHQYQALFDKKKAHEKKVDEYIIRNNVAGLIGELIESSSPENQLRALTLFQGQLSNIFETMTRTHSALLCKAARSGNERLLEGMLNCLTHQLNLCLQQGRPLTQPWQVMFENAVKNGLFLSALQSKNPAILTLLLNHTYNSTPVFDPFVIDKHDKNAFQHAIESGDLFALKALVTYCEKQGIALDSIKMGRNGDTLGHYILAHAPISLKSALDEDNLLKHKLIVLQAKNNLDITCEELIAHQKNPHKETAYSKKTAAFEQEQELAAFVISKRGAARNEKDIDQGVNDLSPIQCLSILRRTNDQGFNFLCQSAFENNPLNSYFAFKLFEKAYNDKTLRETVVALANAKTHGQTPLYMAAGANNVTFLNLFMKHGSIAHTLNTGPHFCPSAFATAARLGACDALIALIGLDRKNYWAELWYPYHHPTDVEGKKKTLFHYLAISDKTGDALCAVLNDSKNNETKFFHPITSHTDERGMSPFCTLLQNPHVETILEKLGNNITSWGVFWGQRKWQLQDIFDFKTPRSNGFTDLEWAILKASPSLLEIIKKFTDPGLFSSAIYKITRLKKQQQHDEMLRITEQEKLHLSQSNRSVEVHTGSASWQAIETLSELSDKNKIDEFIKNLAPDFCLDMLSYVDPDGVNFLCFCAEENKENTTYIALELFKKVMNSNNTTLIKNAQSLMNTKVGERTPFYMACEANNAYFIKAFLKEYKFINTDDAGPKDCPWALTGAAKAGACEAVVEICNATPTNPTKRQLYHKYYHPNFEGDTLLDYLVRNDKTGLALFAVLNNSESHLQSDFHAQTKHVDAVGNSAFYTLLQNPHCKTVIEGLFSQIKEHWKKGWRLDHIFDFNTKRANGYTDLEWAIKTAPHLIEVLKTHTSSELFKAAHEKIMKESLENEKIDEWAVVSPQRSPSPRRKPLLQSSKSATAAQSEASPQLSPKSKNKKKM